jgi:glutaconate CoA-transferase subunit B
MTLESLHPGVSVERVQENLGWPVKVAPQLTTTEAPTADELRLLREELDPRHLYL